VGIDADPLAMDERRPTTALSRTRPEPAEPLAADRPASATSPTWTKEPEHMHVHAYAAPAAGQPLAPTTVERRAVGPNDVLLEIEYAGICHSDIHTVNGDWGPQPFPVVPGHEIVGVVSEVGPQVTGPRVGDRVGVGCMVNSCGECANCRNGDEQYCLEGMVPTYAGTDRDGTTTQGGYSTHVVVDADFVLRVPDGIDPAAAAPLLCAGITTYSPLRRWGAGPGKRVAVVGLGGLGHMAVKLASAMGADVTVLSQSLKKQEDGLRLGADHYYATSDPGTFAELAGRFDLVINTVSASIDVDAYLSLLAVDGALVNVGAPAEPLSLNVMSLIGGRRTYAGSMIGGIAETQEMLDFCAQHGIGAEVEIISASRVNEAYEGVLASDVRYRFVIDAATLR
jgi:alcohol dehydrogenase (NADP+)